MAYFGTKNNDKFVQDLIQVPSNLLDQAVEWIVSTYGPEDVFDYKELEQWAYDNGFKKFE